MIRILLLPLETLVRHRELVLRLAIRDVVARYQGSVLGIAWSLLAPLMMLAIFTLFFGVVFGARWSGPGAHDGVGSFAVFAFAGLIVHGFVAELLPRANGLIRTHASFVKRVIFPLEALIWVPVLSSLFHFIAYLLVLAVVVAIVNGGLPWSALSVVVWLLPAMLLAAGIAWLLAALGVFFRDMGQIIPFLSTALLYISPVFYPIDQVPAALRPILSGNPLAPLIEGIRACVITGQAIEWQSYFLLLAGTWLFALLACWMFRRLSPVFADII